MKSRFSQMSGMYLEVIGPSQEPATMPQSSMPISGQNTGVPLVMKVVMEVKIGRAHV